MPGPDFDQLTVNETARLLGRSTEQVRRYLREGVLPGQRLGGQWFIARDDAEALLRRRQDAAAQLTRPFDPDPLRDTIAIGRGGGGDIADGKVSYLRSVRSREWP
jgi:excisionase family DNA binding protein